MWATCKRCGWCTCNNSCVCSQKQRLEDMRANTPDYPEVDFKQFEWLPRREAIQKFLEVTDKDYISTKDLILLWYK